MKLSAVAPPRPSSLCVEPAGIAPVRSMRSVSCPVPVVSGTTGRSEWLAAPDRPPEESVTRLPPLAAVHSSKASPAMVRT